MPLCTVHGLVCIMFMDGRVSCSWMGVYHVHGWACIMFMDGRVSCACANTCMGVHGHVLVPIHIQEYSD